jgi:hypothetical protein
MPALRNPNAANVLSGNWGTNPGRVRPDTVEDDETIGELAPALELITFAQAWAKIIEMVPLGILKRRDEAAVFETARLWMVINNQTVNAIRSGREPVIENNISTNFRAWLTKLGATPVDSNHVSANPNGKKPKSGDFD